MKTGNDFFLDSSFLSHNIVKFINYFLSEVKVNHSFQLWLNLWSGEQSQKYTFKKFKSYSFFNIQTILQFRSVCIINSQDPKWRWKNLKKWPDRKWQVSVSLPSSLKAVSLSTSLKAVSLPTSLKCNPPGNDDLSQDKPSGTSCQPKPAIKNVVKTSFRNDVEALIQKLLCLILFLTVLEWSFGYQVDALPIEKHNALKNCGKLFFRIIDIKIHTVLLKCLKLQCK